MANPRKLTVKIFESRQIINPYTKKDSSRFFKEDKDLKFWPLYLTITYNRKTKNMKSPTFEFLERMGYGYQLIFGDAEAIRLNDERLLKSFKKIIEENNREFSLDLISPTNEEFNQCKTFIYDFFSTKARSDIYKTLVGLDFQESPNLKYPASIVILAQIENLHFFLDMLKEHNLQLYEEFKNEFTDSFGVLRRLELLASKNIFPFWIDYLLKEDFLEPIYPDLQELDNKNKSFIEA